MGHRVIEIGCIEFVDGKLTGKYWHMYIKPNREVPCDAIERSGIANEFLEDFCGAHYLYENRDWFRCCRYHIFSFYPVAWKIVTVLTTGSVAASFGTGKFSPIL